MMLVQYGVEPTTQLLLLVDRIPDLCTAVITLVIYLCLPLGPPCAEPQIHPIIPELAVDV
jgi:hypothetical protein